VAEKFAKNKIPSDKQFFFFLGQFCGFESFPIFLDFKPKISKNNFAKRREFAKNKIPDYKWKREGGE
jgi:hypothetical protein